MKKLPQTAIEEDYGHAFSAEEWNQIEALDQIAEDLANHCCQTINEKVRMISDRPIEYKAQHTLEELIKKLARRV